METNNSILKISQLIDEGKFDDAFEKATKHFVSIELKDEGDAAYFYEIYQLACLFTDIASYSNDSQAAILAIQLFEQYDEVFSQLINESDYHYNLANAKGNFLSEHNPFKNSFDSIEELVQIKHHYWRALKSANSTDNTTQQYKINLANTLKKSI